MRSFVLRTGRLRWTETTNGNVNAVALVGLGSAQQLVIGGHFTKVGAQVRHKVAVLSPQSGLVDTSAGSWHPAAAGSDLGIYGMLAYGQKVYFGGDFLEWQTHPGVSEQAHLAVFSTTAPADTVAPVVKAPVATIASGATLGTAKVPLSLSWSATDPGSGVCRFHVQRRFSTNPYRAAGPPARDVAERLDRGLAGGPRLHLCGLRDRLLRQHLGVRDRGPGQAHRLPELELGHLVSRRLDRRARTERVRRVAAPHRRGRRERDASLHRPRGRVGGIACRRRRQRAGADRRPRGRDDPPAVGDDDSAPGGLHPQLGSRAARTRSRSSPWAPTAIPLISLDALLTLR